MPSGSFSKSRRSASSRYSPDLCFGGANYRRRFPPRSRRNSAPASVKRQPEGPLAAAGRLLGGVADALDVEICNGPGFGFPARIAETEVKLLLFLVAGGTVLVGFAACALVIAATKAIRRAKAGAKRHDATCRKALRSHGRARHRPPTPEMLLEHWKKSRTTLEGKLLLGSLMCDLAACVDASYVRGDEGEIIGRQGGIRGWLGQNAPGLLSHYKTLMHYKTVADKFRLACGLEEPDGAEEALGETLPEHAETAVETPARHPKAAELLEKGRTMTALETALNGELGLIRFRRRAS